MIKHTAMGLLTLVSFGAIGADQEQQEKSFTITRISGSPDIDGIIDEAVWGTSEVIDDFLQIFPTDTAPPTEKTEIRLLYNDDFLYISGVVYDSEPDQLIANVMKHGNGLRSEDRVGVVIDPFNTGRNGYWFGTNPNGIRHEMLYTNITSFNGDWEAIWDVASQRNDQGWTFEMAIPFKSLPFNSNIDTWGVNFTRTVSRKGEEVVWVSRNRTYNPSIVGQMRGLQDMNQGVGLDIVPSVINSNRKIFPSNIDSTVEPSLDAYYRITPSLNGALTINTDFSAADVDNRQVNLTRFNLFFPERRNFFLNDSDLFQFGRIGRGGNSAATGASRQSGRPFFSRRIGLGVNGQQVDIDYGARLSGRVGRWSIGSLAVRQDAYNNLDASNLFVSRIQSDVLNESSAGIIITSGDPNSNLDNTVLGADFLYLNTSLPGGSSIEAESWFQKSESEGISGDDSAFGLGFFMPNAQGFRGGVEFKEIQDNFNPALGFISRHGIRDYDTTLGYTYFIPGNLLRSVYSGVDFERIDTIGGANQSQTTLFRLFELSSNTNDSLSLIHRDITENVTSPFSIYSDETGRVLIDAGKYSFNETGLSMYSGNQRNIYGGVSYTQGDFYDGDRVNVESQIGWNPVPQLDISLQFDWNRINLPQRSFITRLVRAQFSYAIFLGLTWDNLIQYDNVSEVIGINSRLSWNVNAGQEAFIVLNRNWQDLDRDGDFQSQFSDLSIKFRYTFRF